MMHAIESRREQRVQADIDVEYSLPDSPVRYRGRATDVSLGGIRIDGTTALPFNATAVVYMRLPGTARPLALEGIVRWARGGTMGLQFGLLSARETYALIQLAFASRQQALDAADVAWVG